MAEDNFPQVAPSAERLKEYVGRKQSLLLEKSSWTDHWRELSENILPRNGRFLVSDRNLGAKRHNKIYDSTGTKAARTASAGLLAGASSPARPWFRLATPDRDLMEYQAVKIWLEAVSRKMRDIFNGSNYYRALHKLYDEIVVFGTAGGVMLPHYNNVVHTMPLTIGEYAIAVDEWGDVNTLFREYEMSVVQLVSRFGLKNVSPHVRDLYNKGAGLDKWITVNHLIQPRLERNTRSPYAKDMPIMSCYWEDGVKDGRLLHDGGFKRFPGLAPRWDVSGGDIYGTSPGQDALGDIKQLQHQNLRKGQAIDYQTKPPIQVPTSQNGKPVNMLPGGVSYIDITSAGGAKALFESRLPLRDLTEDIVDVRQRIRGAFYADLFMMLANDDRSGTTAREIAERHEEKLLMLGPVLERLNSEVLKPSVDLTFDRMIEAHLVPPPPPEMQGQELTIEFVSVLAQAQRAVGVQAVDLLLGKVASIAAAKGDLGVWDKIDVDQTIDRYAEMLGAEPDIIVADENVAIIREQRAQAQAKQQQMAQAEQAAATAQKLASADTSGSNALTDLMQQFSGYSVPVRG